MLQIKLRKPSNETGGAAKPLHSDSVTVACPDHLVLADLPVAKSLGFTSATPSLKVVGRKSRRHLGERVHFCVRCDFPIAIYGRLSPCNHAFCLDCARSDSLCYLCDERIQKIQTIKLMEGIFICAAPHCIKSFLKKNEFEAHIHGNHADLLHQSGAKNLNVVDAANTNTRKAATSESTVQTPLRSDSTLQAQNMSAKLTSPPIGQIQKPQTEQSSDNNPPPGFERSDNNPPQGGSPFPEYSTNHPQRHGFMHANPNPVMPPSSQFGYPQFLPESFYGSSYDGGSEQGLQGVNFGGVYPRPWNVPWTETGQGDYSMDSRDGKSNMSQPSLLPPPPPLPSHMHQLQRGRSYSGDAEP